MWCDLIYEIKTSDGHKKRWSYGLSTFKKRWNYRAFFTQLCRSTYNIIFDSGYVAFVAGGDVDKVELYSPNGKCQYNLAPMPVIVYDPVLYLIGTQVKYIDGSLSLPVLV